MQTNVTFRHLKSNPQLQDAAVVAAEKFERFFDGISSTDIVFKNESDKIVEFTVRVNGNTLNAKEKSEDFGKSLNLASDKMVRQLRKWKTKINPTI
jgi:putative sigma-54 modulation protein